MGGPCYIVRTVPEENNRVGKFQGPVCTDNFQIAKFRFKGKTWHSVEQCFQAQKFPAHSSTYQLIHSTSPRIECVTGEMESSSSYGHRVWKLGQVRETPLLDDWEETKVRVMAMVNCAKYACNPNMQRELDETTRDWELLGGASTWDWSKWNGLIQLWIRKMIRRGEDLGKVLGVSLAELEACAVAPTAGDLLAGSG